MSEDYERTTVTSTPERVVEVRRGSSAGWWVAALVAIVAIVAVVFLFSNNASQSQLEAARDQGIADANLANATLSAQQAAATASQAAQDAAAAGARATETAAQAAAEGARSAGDAAAEAADAVTLEPPQ